MALRVYNTLTRQKEDFQTVRAGHVGMYVCGPTVYKPSHIGRAEAIACQAVALLRPLNP